MMKELLKTMWIRRKGDIAVKDIVYVIAAIIAVALTLLIVFGFARENLVIKYD